MAPSSVRIVEVGPRDGLQNISSTIPTTTKISLIRQLHDAGLHSLEPTSAVSPRAVPQLADCAEVLSDSNVQSLMADPRNRLPVLVPNLKGLEIARANGVRQVAVFVAASEGFSNANIRCSVSEGLERARQVATRAKSLGIKVRGYVSCIFSCPYDGPVSHAAVFHVVSDLLDMGCYEVSLGDTVGVGAAPDVKRLLAYLVAHGIPLDKLAGHFHDTYGQGVGNVWAAYEYGLRIFDSSVAGLGGCPYAPGAKGNVATEDVVYMFERAGVDSGVDLDKVVRTGDWISKQLQRPNESRAGLALAAAARAPKKDGVSKVMPSTDQTSNKTTNRRR